MVNKKKHKCRRCKDPFVKKFPLVPVCENCAYQYAKDKKEIADKKKWAKDKKARKEQNKTLTQYENEAKKEFQAWVRIRDKGLPCISCGCVNCLDEAGGHYFDAGMYSGLIFHEDNCNKQCNAHCNRYLHGNKPNYRIGLLKKIGEERVKWLEENKDSLRDKKYTKSELIEIKLKYKNK